MDEHPADAPAKTDGPDADHRLFVAIELPEELRSALIDLQERLRKGFNFTPCRPTWSRPETMHLTLRFLGKFSDAMTAPLTDDLAATAARHAPVRLAPGGLGVFPHWHAPRVLWAGVHERTGALDRLQAEIEQVARRHAARPEPNRFQAHLTLARFQSMRGIEAARQVVRGHQKLRLPSFEAERVVLFDSQRDEGVLRHTPLASFPLRRVQAAAVQNL